MTYYCLLSPRFWPTPVISEVPHKNDGAANRCPVNPGEFTPIWSGSPSAPPVPEETPGPCGFESLHILTALALHNCAGLCAFPLSGFTPMLPGVVGSHEARVECQA